MKDKVQIQRFGLSLLGRFELTAPDGVVHLPSKKLAGLLAYLACKSRPQPRERLADLLWGAHFEAQARQNLRQALSLLRRILGHEALVSEDNEVSLAPGVIDCDVIRFEALVAEGSRASLAAAADLYRNPLLTDLNIAEEAWLDWRNSERERLAELAVDSMVRHGQQALRAGSTAAALKNANRAIAVNALREDAHRLTIQALAASGRTAEALKYYQDLAVRLKRELSTEPDAATRLLVAELRSAPPPDASRTSNKPHRKMRGTSGGKTDTETTAARANNTAAEIVVRSSSFEQRQLTIMVCNLIGPTSYTENLDPEDIHDRIAIFQKTAAEVAARFGGFVAQYQGYGVLVYFGYPAAHEHDAERAVRAGLAILDSIGKVVASPEMQLRASVGIATGLVVVGETSAIDHNCHHIATGQTPNLATRLQTRAASGEVVIATSTQRLLGGRFDCRELDPIELKGQPYPIEAWQVYGERTDVSRYEARHGARLSPLVGRQEEAELLLRRWSQSRSGEGRVVVISGEAGIGKSRIAENMLAVCEAGSHACFRYSCSPDHADSALFPFIVQIEQQADFRHGDSDSTKLEKLEALLKPTSADLPRHMALFSELLSLPMDGRHPALKVSPQQKQEMTLGALLSRLKDAATRAPLLIVFEDAHWIDPTSLDLLERMVSSATQMPLLLIVTFRPGFQPNWADQPHVTALPLNRLGLNDGAEIIRSMTPDKALPNAVIEHILSRTDGVPLFIEELTQTLLDSGLLREDVKSFVLEGPLPSHAIPTTLHASLVARLDLLGSAKEVAMIGAAIGREFSHELITAVSDLPPVELDAALAQLTASGLILHRGAPSEASYLFKHALIQDAAYVTMLKSRRRQLHARIAKTLIERFPAFVEKQPEMVARHFTEAGLVSEAISFWVKAGRHAYARWANREAAGFFDHAARLLEKLPESRETLEQAIDLRFDLKASLIPLGQFKGIVSYLHEAEVLARRLNDQRRSCLLSIHMCQTLGLSGNSKDAIAFGQTAQSLAELSGDIPLRAAAALFLGTACFSMLNFRSAEEHFLKVLELLDGGLSLEQFSLSGLPAVTAHSYLTRIYADQGGFQRGVVHGEEGVRLAEAVDHPYSLAIACWCLADLMITRGELGHAIGLLERGLKVARKWNLPFLAAGSSGSLGYAYALQGQTAEGLPLLEQALSVFEKMGHQFALSLFLIPLGEMYMHAGRPARALEVAERALAIARESGQRSGEAGALRLLGDVSAVENSPEIAENHYRDALALAAELKMSPLVARCHHGLGKLYLRTGQPNQARLQLDAATTMYRGMNMLFWLEQAEAEFR